MTRRPAAVVAAAAVMAMLAGSAGADGVRAALTLAPADAAAVVAVDLGRFRSSVYWPRLRDAVMADAGLAAGLTQVKDLGLDIERDLTSVVCAVPEPMSRDRFVLIAAGDFRALDLARLVGATRRLRHKTAYYAIDGEHALALVGRHLVFGTTAELEAVIDVHAGKARALGKQRAVKALVAGVGTKGDLWLYLDAGALPQRSKMTGLARIGARADLRAGMVLELRLVHRDEEAARSFEGEMDSLLKGFAGSSGPLGPLVAALTHRRVGLNLDITLRLDQKQLDDLTSLAGYLR